MPCSSASQAADQARRVLRLGLDGAWRRGAAGPASCDPDSCVGDLGVELRLRSRPRSPRSSSAAAAAAAASRRGSPAAAPAAAALGDAPRTIGRSTKSSATRPRTSTTTGRTPGLRRRRRRARRSVGSGDRLVDRLVERRRSRPSADRRASASRPTAAATSCWIFCISAGGRGVDVRVTLPSRVGLRRARSLSTTTATDRRAMSPRGLTVLRVVVLPIS